MSLRARRYGAMVAVVLLAGGLRTACTFSVGGGLAAAVIALLVGGGLLFTATTQSGCDRTTACLSMAIEAGPDAARDAGPDAKVGPCLGAPKPDAKVGPCLQPKPDMYVGPCLDVKPDTGPPKPDIKVGPCLGPPKPDAKVGPCLKMKPDAKVGPCLKMKPDAKVGPCLAPPPPGSAALVPEADEDAPAARERSEIVARLRGRLPADLAARLDDEGRG